jgi:hypothetical protein
MRVADECAPHAAAYAAYVSELTVDEVRAHIDAGTCPFCGAGPYAMLPVHTAKAHGVDKWALRDLAHLTAKEPLCSAEARAKMRDAYGAESAERLARVRHLSRGGSQRRTRAGRERNIQAVRTWATENPDAYRESLARAWANSVASRRIT